MTKKNNHHTANHYFFSSLGLLLALNFLIKPFWVLGIDRAVQNQTGTTEYGLYFALFNLSFIGQFLLDGGLLTYINREIAARSSSFSVILSRVLGAKLILLIPYFLLMSLTGWAAGITAYWLFFSLLVLQAFISFLVFFRTVIAAEQFFRANAWLSVLDRSLMILGFGLLFLFPNLFGRISIALFVGIQLSATGIAILSCLFFLRRKQYKIQVDFRSWADPGWWKPVAPYALLTLLMAIHNRLDGFLLERLHPHGDYEAGIYAASYRLLDAGSMLAFLFASILLPFIARNLGQRQQVQQVVLQSRHLLMLAAALAVAVSLTSSNWIQTVLYRHDSAYAAEVMKNCLPALFGYYLVWIYGTVLTAYGKIKTFARIILFSLLVNLTINLLFIPNFGALAAARAATLSQSIAGILLFVYAVKRLYMQTSIRTLLIYVFSFLALLLFLLLMQCLKMPVGLSILLAGILQLLIGWLSKLITLQGGLALLKKGRLTS